MSIPSAEGKGRVHNVREQQRRKIHKEQAKEVLAAVGGEGWVVLDN